MGKTKRNFWLLLLTALFVMLSLVLVFFLSGAFRRPVSTIVLPNPNHTGPAGVDGLTPNYLNQPAEYLEMELTADNILPVLRALRRPAAYTATYIAELYAEETQTEATKTNVTAAVKGGLARYEVTPAKGRAYSQLVTARFVYSFQAGSPTIVKTARGSQETDRLGGLPSYEELAQYRPEQIESCLLEERDGLYSIVVSATNGGYAETYRISLLTGLLTGMEARQNGVLIYVLSQTGVSTDEPDDGVFLLPSGQAPE